MPFFSIIVPQHNSATFMRKGLDSIKEQTFKDYQLIIICDSCTDNTLQIAKEYTDKVYETDAKSAGVARNTGLEHATGQWILFMDDDDWWLHDYAFEMLAEKLKTINTDILAFSFILKGRGYAKCGKWIAIWNKVWKHSFIEKGQYKFPNCACADDVKWAEDTHPKATWTYWDMPFYYYNYLHQGSLSWRAKNGEQF